jgi:hypothetical protein
MALVTKYSLAYKDPASVLLPKPVYAGGRGRCLITGPIAVASGDNPSSKHYWGKIPSHAIILPTSTMFNTAITGLNNYAIGLEYNGVSLDPDALSGTLDLTSAGNKNPAAALVIATGIGKQLWQAIVPAIPRDPGVEYDIVGIMGAAAGAAGTIEGFIYFAIK